RHPALGRGPRGQAVEHRRGQTPAAVCPVDRDLPDEQGVRAVGAYVSGDETDRLAALVASAGRGGGDVPAPQQIAVRRVQLEDLRVPGYPRRHGSIRHGGAVDLQVCLCGSHANWIYRGKFKTASPDGLTYGLGLCYHAGVWGRASSGRDVLVRAGNK